MKLTDHEMKIPKDEIVLMVQKSGDHQFSLLVYHLLSTDFILVFLSVGGFLAGFSEASTVVRKFTVDGLPSSWTSQGKGCFISAFCL